MFKTPVYYKSNCWVCMIFVLHVSKMFYRPTILLNMFLGRSLEGV